jgi:type I restriction enzyme M protein
LIRAIRAKLNLTQAQLADRLGVSFASVNRWEGGISQPQKAARDAIQALAGQAGLDDNAGPEPEQAAAEITRRRRSRATAKETAGSTRPMEQMLWDAACSIRGEKDAPKFKDYLRRSSAAAPLSTGPRARRQRTSASTSRKRFGRSSSTTPRSRA